MKPYYNLETKETYRKFNCGNVIFKCITGSVTIGSTTQPTIWRNEFGEIVKQEPFIEYVRIT